MPNLADEEYYNSASFNYMTDPKLVALLLWLIQKKEFDLDPCALWKNIPAKTHYMEADDGLVQPWFGSVFMNSPYGNWLRKFLRKAQVEAMKPGTEVFGLIPLRGRCKQIFYHDLVFGSAKFIFVIQGKSSFLIDGEKMGEAPHDLAIAYWGSDLTRARELMERLDENELVKGSLVVPYKVLASLMAEEAESFVQDDPGVAGEPLERDILEEEA